MRRHFMKFALTSVIAAASFAAHSQENTSPIRILVGYAPGGAIDSVARAVADKLKDTLRQPIIVDNKPGANQRLALLELKRSKPDGLTLMVSNNVPFTVFPHVYKRLDFDPVKDFTPIGLVARFELCVAAGPMTPAKDIQQLITWAKANPQQASYATSGPAGMGHFTGLLLGRAAGVPFNHVAYKGGSPGLLDLAGGQIPIMVDTCQEPLEMSKGGKVRLLATTGSKRSSVLPNIPTLRESGVDAVAEAYVAVYAPGNLPADKVKRLSAALQEALKSQDVNQRIIQAAMNPTYGTPEELAAAQKSGLEIWGSAIKGSGITLD